MAELTAVAAVQRDLERLPEHLSTGTLAATAMEMARLLDGNWSATAKSNCGRVLADVMSELQSLAPAEVSHDAVDEISARRRRAA